MVHAFLFPGQGAQKVGMGADLFDSFPEETHSASTILGYDLKELCLKDPHRQLGLTQFTQPALYVVNALTFFATADAYPAPAYLAGHSLGEYNALFAAGAFDFATGLQLVKERGALMGRAQGGGMAAVVGMSSDRIQAVLAQEGVDSIDIANLNAPSQIAISGPAEDIRRMAPVLEKAGARRCIVLNVSAAFHSRYMAPHAESFARFLEGFLFKPLSVPVIANRTARPYQPGSVGENLAGQIRDSVRWTDSMRFLLAKGVTDMVELGPGRVLTNLLRAIKQEAEPLDLSADSASSASEVPAPVSQPPTWDKEAGGVPNPSVPALNGRWNITAEGLGSPLFRKRYGVRYAYVAGSMYKGISSKELVVRMGRAGLIGFYGTGGLTLSVIEDGLRFIQSMLSQEQVFGVNLLNNLEQPQLEMELVSLYLRFGIRFVEASAFILMSEALVYFRLKGVYRDSDGAVIVPNRILSKVSRPEVAEAFMSPPPPKLVARLLEKGLLSSQEAALAPYIPMSHEVCVEADSGGHTDAGVAYALMPAMLRLRERLVGRFQYEEPILIGAAGGIGAPEAAAAAFILGADFILTGSVNQCSPEAGTSDLVKDMLQAINVQDTDYAPAGDMFELGARVQVMKRGLFFPARAQKLYELYRQFDSLDSIDEKTRQTIQDKYFRRSFAEVWQETRAYYARTKPGEIEKAERNPKHKMALIFKWYFIHSNRLALGGEAGQKVDFQVHCGPALGAFNQSVLGTNLEDWRNRHVDLIAERLMQGAAEVLGRRFAAMAGQ